MKVCFFSPTAYSYFNPDSSTWAGGAETQQVLIARHMIRRGIEVNFIVGDYGQADAELVGEITLIKSFEPFTGNRKLRFIPDMMKIQRAMKIADADVYNQRSTSFFTGQLSYFARRLGRAFTFSIGIDYNCYPDCSGRLPLPLTLLYRYGIRNADAVIAQTGEQQRLMEKNFKRKAVLIRNGIVIPPPGEPEKRRDPGSGDSLPRSGNSGDIEFLWVGSFRRRKRPELYLELAENLPEATFTIVGGKGDDADFFADIQERAANIPNVNYAGFVPPGEIETYYRRAYAFINTSNLEGFPNTYLHSWIHGVPTFTIEIDPDGIIEKNRIGETTRNFERLVEAVKHLCGNPVLRSEMSARARSYVEKNHDITEKGDDYIRLFEYLLSMERRSSSRRSG